MSPSIGTDTALDLLVKEPLIQEALLLAATPSAPPNVDPDQWRDTHETKVCWPALCVVHRCVSQCSRRHHGGGTRSEMPRG